jgi:EmrB/QacA subfamily drug resistance transporter
VGRIIQSIGTGVTMPLALNIITVIFPLEKRGTVMGIYGLGVILAPALGPSIGGFVIQFMSWKILFLSMALLEIIVLVGAIKYFYIKNDISKEKFDILGFILSAMGCGLLLYSISEKQIIIIIASCIILFLFVLHCNYKKDNALLNVIVFKDYHYSYSLVINIIFTMAMYSGMLLMPMYLQQIRGFSPLNAALIILPGSLAMGVLGIVTGKIFDKYGIKLLAIIGSLIMCSVTLLFSNLSMNTPIWFIVFIYLLRSVGVAMVISPIASAGLVKLKHDLIPDANALTNTIKQIFGSIGSSFSIVMMSMSSTAYFNGKNANEAYLHGINFAFLVMSGIALIAFILSLLYKTRK